MELNRKCLPLKDVKSIRALNAYCALMLGMKMIPGNAHLGFEEFLGIVEEFTPEEKLKLLVNAAKIVELQPEEIKALVCFCTDRNGVPYTSENVKSLSMSELIEVIVTVCYEVMTNINVDLITKDEKKNFSVDIRRAFLKRPDETLEEALNLAFYEATRVI